MPEPMKDVACPHCAKTLKPASLKRHEVRCPKRAPESTEAKLVARLRKRMNEHLSDALRKAKIVAEQYDTDQTAAGVVASLEAYATDKKILEED